MVENANELSEGQEILDLANSTWRPKHDEYRGLPFSLSVHQAKRQIERKPGQKRRDRKAEAVRVVTAMFNHVRDQEAGRLNRICGEVQLSSSEKTFSAGSELQLFASEISEVLAAEDAIRLDSKEDKVSELADPQTIISIIMAIIEAIRKCRETLKPLTPPA